MMVDLPEPDGPTSAVTRAWFSEKRNVVKHGLAGVVGKVHVIEDDLADDRPKRGDPARILVFRTLAQNFARPLQAGQRFGELGSDSDDLEHGRDQKRQQRGERHEIAQRHGSGGDLARADVHDDRAHDAHQHGG